MLAATAVFLLPLAGAVLGAHAAGSDPLRQLCGVSIGLVAGIAVALLANLLVPRGVTP